MTPTKVTRIYSKREPALTLIGGATKQVTISLNALDAAFPDLFAQGDQLTQVSSYSQVSWIYRCVNLRADTLAGLPRAFFKEGKNGVFDDRVEDDEVPEEWAEVDFDWLLWRTEAARCIWGVSYWTKDARLMWLNPTSITVEYNAERTEIKQFVQNPGGGKWKPDQLVYQPLWNPSNDLAPGVSPAQAALTAAGLSRYLDVWASGFFERGAIPAVVLTTERIIKQDDPEVKRIKAMWKKATGTVRRAWETVIIGKGLTPKIIGMPVKDLAMPELSEEAREAMAASFGVPITMLQQGAANFATAREDVQGYYKATLFPEARHVQSAANIQVFRPAGYEMRFLFGEVEAIQQDEAEKAAGISDLMEQAQKQYEGNILTRDRTVWVVENLWDQMGLKFPEDLKDEKPEEPETSEETGSEEASGVSGTMAPEMIAAQQAMQQAAQNLRKDLRRWRRKVKSRGADCTFTSEHIPEWAAKAVRMRLLNGCDDVFRPWLEAKTIQPTTEQALINALIAIFGEFLPGISAAVEAGDIPDLEDMYRQIRGAAIPIYQSAIADEVIANAADLGWGVDYEDLLIDSNEWAREHADTLVGQLADTNRKRFQSLLADLEAGRITPDAIPGLLEGFFGDVRAKMVGVTEATRAMREAAARLAASMREAGIEVVERWLTAEDERVCQICGPLDHTTEETWGQVISAGPPAHVNCILPGNEVIAPGGISAAAKSFYVGRAIEVTLANGSSLTVTESHPILTRRGWVAAMFLDEGEEVFYTATPERIAAAINPDNDHMPTRIEEIYRALEEADGMISARVPPTAMDFHSDGRFIDGDINVVYPAGLLLGDGETEFGQLVGEPGFGRDDVRASSLVGQGTAAAFLKGDGSTFGGAMGGPYLMTALSDCHPLPLGTLTGRLVTGGNFGSQKPSPEDPTADTSLARQFILRFAGDVARQESSEIGDLLAQIATLTTRLPDGEAMFAEAQCQRAVSDPQVMSDVVEGVSGDPVSLMQVSTIRDFDFAGHVYDLQCDMYGLYFTSGVVSKNCRCLLNVEYKRKSRR